MNKTTKKRKRHPVEEEGEGEEDERGEEKQKSGTFDSRIKALNTGKDDIPQCHVAQHKLVPGHPFRFMLSGATGSGKSTVLLNLLTRFYVNDDGSSYFDKIYAIGPTVKFDDLWKSLDLPEDQLIDEIDEDSLNEVFEDQEAVIKGEGIAYAPRVCIVFEDIITEDKFMRSKEFLKMFVMSRHYGISVMICTQSYTKVPRACRLNCSNIVFFPSNVSEMTILTDEYCPPRMHKKEFMQLMMEATTPDERDEYPFLYIDQPAKPNDRFRKTFNRSIRIGNKSKSSSWEKSINRRKGKGNVNDVPQL